MDNIKNHDIFEEYESLQNIKEKSIDFLKIDELYKSEQIQTLRKKYSDSLDYIRGYEASQHTTKKASDSELIVLGSGNLGLIYLTQWKHRLTYEEIISLFPDLIPGLVKHPGIGFILVNSLANGGMVIGKNGIYYLESDEIIGENPLADFGKNAPKHLKRHNTFKNMPDILVNSFYDPESGDICAFEELIGSHGGLGGTQTKPFILYPSDWDCPDELVGAKSIYDLLKNGMKKLKRNKMENKIYIIGIGPGSSEYLTKKAVDTVKTSDYTVGSTRAIDLFDDVNNKIAFNVKDLLDKLEKGVDLAIEGNTVSILSTGDPGFSGVLNTVLRIANEKNFPEEKIEVIPGISSLQLAAARNHIQWDNANVMTFHGRENIEDILKVINNGKTTIALPSKKVRDMAQFLLDNGVDEHREVVVCERLSYDDEKIVRSTLKDIANSEFTYMCIMVIY